MKPYKQVKKFLHRSQVVQLSQKDICSLLDINVTNLREAIEKMRGKGYLFVEKNHGKSNRYHYVYKG